MTRRKAKSEGLQLAWLKSFVRVAESGKRTAAAHEMEINQGTVTKHIQKLEDWLGGGGPQKGRRLLFDLNAPSNLTPFGEEFLPAAEQILELLDHARRPLVPTSTPPTKSSPPVSPKDFKVPPLRQPQKEGGG